MAETADGLDAPDPRSGVPAALGTAAYTRCVAVLGAAFNGLLRDPALAQERLLGMYALMHAIQDSFSAAHVARDDQGRIMHPKSWTLIDWPTHWAHGRGAFPAVTHRAIDGQTIGLDVAGLAAVGVLLRRFEVSVESPPLSYVSRGRCTRFLFRSASVSSGIDRGERVAGSLRSRAGTELTQRERTTPGSKLLRRRCSQGTRRAGTPGPIAEAMEGALISQSGRRLIAASWSV